jgi:V/A-type H+-transporting ATPase subunit E
MEQKIQELTGKIYQEGVQKGEERARLIIAEAESKAAGILADAKAQGEKIIADAQKQAGEIKRNLESELKLSGTQAISAIKQQIANTVSARVVEGAITSSLSDPTTIKELVSTVVQNWKVSAGEVPTLEILLPLAKQGELQDAFKKGASDLLKKGLQLSFTNNVKAGFKIGPLDGTYRISLTDEDFQEFFKEYLRAKTRSYLFGE